MEKNFILNQQTLQDEKDYKSFNFDLTTISFIGSDKNSGKTTALNFVYNKLVKQKTRKKKICLTSIGINGEKQDVLNGQPKPLIYLYKNTYFITNIDHLNIHDGKYKIFHIFSGNDFSKRYVLGKCVFDFPIMLEGPNDKKSILSIKQKVKDLLKQSYLLIDGSVDRQILAHPAISDAIYFSVLISNQNEQIQKTKALLSCFSIPLCCKNISFFLADSKNKDIINKNTKSLLFNEKNVILYHGQQVLFLDAKLKQNCLKHKHNKCYLYLNGAFSKSLYIFLSKFNNLNIILDNLTCYQNLLSNIKHCDDIYINTFDPKLFLFHSIKVLGIFLKEEKKIKEIKSSLMIPDGIPFYNLFKNDISKIDVTI